MQVLVILASILAAGGTTLAQKFGADLEVLAGYFLVLGVHTIVYSLQARKHKVPIKQMVKTWALHDSVQLLTIIVIVTLTHQIKVTAQVEIFTINWLCVAFTAMNISNVVKMLEQEGVYVHPLVHIITKLVTERTIKKIMKVLDDPELDKYAKDIVDNNRSDCGSTAGVHDTGTNGTEKDVDGTAGRS